MVAERSLTEGQEADDRYATAGGAWAMVQAPRDFRPVGEALSDGAAGELAPHLEDAPDDWSGEMSLPARFVCAAALLRSGRQGVRDVG